MVEAQVERERDPDYELDKDGHRRLVRFGELIDWLRKDEASNDIYLTAYNSGNNAAALAPLWDDVAPIALLDDRRERDGFFWLGPRGTLTPWHHDLTNNLLVQVIGRKRVRMAPPWAFARMRNSRHCFSDWGNEALPAGEGDGATPPVLETIIGPAKGSFCRSAGGTRSKRSTCRRASASPAFADPMRMSRTIGRGGRSDERSAAPQAVARAKFFSID